MHHWNIQTDDSRYDQGANEKDLLPCKVEKIVDKLRQNLLEVLDDDAMDKHGLSGLVEGLRYEARVTWRRTNGDSLQVPGQKSNQPSISVFGAHQHDTGSLLQAKVMLEALVDLALAVAWTENHEGRQKIFTDCGLDVTPDLRNAFDVVGMPLDHLRASVKEMEKDVKECLGDTHRRPVERGWSEGARVCIAKHQMDCGICSYRNLTPENKRHLRSGYAAVITAFTREHNHYRDLVVQYGRMNYNDKWVVVR